MLSSELRKLINYLGGIWGVRFFWFHLALSDLRTKWRRSYFGILWSMMQPLGLTILLACVFSRLFHTNIVTYIPYIFSGIITWEFINQSVSNGSLVFVQAESYIKQCTHPLAIYTVRVILTNLITLIVASSGLFIWVFCTMPQNINSSWLAILTFFPIICLMVWPLTNSLAYLGARFRDIPYAMTLIFQAIWFISPVYFEENMFRGGGLNFLVDYNPIYHLLQILRAPLLQGHWPSVTNYLFCFFTFIFFLVLTIPAGKYLERKVIFYL